VRALANQGAQIRDCRWPYLSYCRSMLMRRAGHADRPCFPRGGDKVRVCARLLACPRCLSGGGGRERSRHRNLRTGFAATMPGAALEEWEVAWARSPLASRTFRGATPSPRANGVLSSSSRPSWCTTPRICDKPRHTRSSPPSRTSRRTRGRCRHRPDRSLRSGPSGEARHRQPALGTDDASALLTTSTRAGLVVGLLVIIATAVLVAMPTPMMPAAG
jgi:hypothetical protein